MPTDARAKLHAAFEQLPISYVLLGWNLPEPLVSACREEATQEDAQLYLWYPLLTGDGAFVPHPKWRTIGLQGEPVPGYRGMAEFTFACPNRPAVREAVLDHLGRVLERGDFDGVFLDRIRYPSPASDPTRWLACFCDDCGRAATADGLDLEAVRQSTQRLLTTPDRVPSFLRASLGPAPLEPTDPDVALVVAFLDFRARSISRFVQAAARLIHGEGLVVGLDCFSPALTRLVGQDLGTLDACCEWIKVMVYGHTLGPAGLPFELLDLATWLTEKGLATETRALEWLSQATGLRLPPSRNALRVHGLEPSALHAEIARARTSGIDRLLAGVELVQLPGVTYLHPEQITADLRAFHAAGADGLVLSWDLWHVPPERLALVRAIWSQ
jgi:hypothetical protein